MYSPLSLDFFNMKAIQEEILLDAKKKNRIK